MPSAEIPRTLDATRRIVARIESNLNALHDGNNATELTNGGDETDEKTFPEKSAKDLGIESESEKEGETRKVSTRRSHSSGGDVDKIYEHLEELIMSDEWIHKESKDATDTTSHQDIGRKKSQNVTSPRLSELGRALISTSALKTYIDLLGAQHKQSIASWIYGSTAQTLSTLLRTPNNNLYCSDQKTTSTHSVRAGIGYAVRLALRDIYGPEYCTKGWKIFLEMGAPVVYLSPALHIELETYLASEFSISDIVSLEKMDGAYSDIEGRIDHVAFQKQIDNDIAAGKKPLIVIGVVGSAIFGLNDMISRLLECRKQKCNFWIHAVGQGLAALCLKEPSEMLVHVLSQVDSFTIPLGIWLGEPAAPVVTLHRPVENYRAPYRDKLDLLPWWVTCQYLTSGRITDIIENAYFLSKVMLRELTTLSQIEILGIENPIELANRVYKGNSTSPTVLVFKYKYEVQKKQICQEKVSTDDMSISINYKDVGLDYVDDVNDAIEYADSLNSWLGQGLIPECRQLGLQMFDLPTCGNAFRFCPLESAAMNYTHVDQVHKFMKRLADALMIIESTAAARNKFKEIITNYPSLAQLPVHKWAGVGAVCYIPSIVKETDPSEWNEKQRQQVTHLNLELVHALRSLDTAFSSGDCELYGVTCVKFGMLSDDKDLADLVHLVANKGKEIEQSQQYLESLAKMIREGIEAANEGLKRENNARLMQEGVMRQIPLMGSLVNWFAPLDKEVQNIRGRSFDLKTGQIHSSDIYLKNRLMKQSSDTSLEHQYSANQQLSNISVEQQDKALSSKDMTNGSVHVPHVVQAELANGEA